MIRKPDGYDSAVAYTGESVSLPAGLYVCEIKGVKLQDTKNGRPQLAIAYDIAEGEYKGFYQQRYEAAKKNNAGAQWPGAGVHKQLMDGSSISWFKGVMTSIERSNPGYTFPWDRENNEKTLTGKKFGAVMGREQFKGNDGKLAFATKIAFIRSLDGLKNAEIPADKLLEDTGTAPAPASDPALAADGFLNIADGVDEELPFM